MIFDENIRCELVWDGTDVVRVPSVVGEPAPGQMVGTPHERLGEVSCRTCYESCGIDPVTKKPKGRTSAKLHEHIKQTKNHSVYEHCVSTLDISGVDTGLLAMVFINRPGVWFQGTHGDQAEVTLNHRCALEWDTWTNSQKGTYGPSVETLSGIMGNLLYNYFRTLAPSIYEEARTIQSFSNINIREKTENLTQDQAWVSLYLSGSRGFGNEQVRHGEFSAISQRSTRFVDETDTPYIVHPLLSYFFEDRTVSPDLKERVLNWVGTSKSTDQSTYIQLVEALQPYLQSRGVEGTSARKQARGAARGYLGNALFTDMVFSANVRQWRWILSQRAAALADAEIRNLYAPHVLRELKASQYSHMFSDLELAPSPDGIGQIVVPVSSGTSWSTH